MEIITLILTAICVLTSLTCLILVWKTRNAGMEERVLRFYAESERRQGEARHQNAAVLEKRMETLRAATDTRLSENQRAQNERLDALAARVEQRLLEGQLQQNTRLDALTQRNEQKLEEIRSLTERKLSDMQGVVDEKLQKTLDERISKSFEAVSKNLEAVYKGLGEMQTMASEVGDLKKVLSNVKSRGMMGEYQLSALLEQLLSPEQYVCNAAASGTAERVEFAIKMPGGYDGEAPVLLPVDSKFPLDRYAVLCDAYESGEKSAVETAQRELRAAVILSAKTITKYISPPETTDFAIMFLPFEGLYAEVIRMGLLEELAAGYRVNVTGPSTMGAFLNSLQMGFRTLRIQKSSSEVWKVLGKARTEFESFTAVLDKAKRSLDSTSAELEKLVGVRSRGILRALKNVQTQPEGTALPAWDEGE